MDAIYFLRIIIPVFFAILFLQSGLDKVFDWKGNVEFHGAHFSQSPFKKIFKFNLALIAFLEICCGVLCVAGAIFTVLHRECCYSLYGVELAAVIFAMLFFGQRISK